MICFKVLVSGKDFFDLIMDILVEDEYFWILILVESLDVLYFLDLGEDLLDSKGDDWEILDFVV